MLAVIFPGQGAQFPGMARDLLSQFGNIVDQASAILGQDVVALCDGREPLKMNSTEYTQPILYLVCVLGYLAQDKQADFLLGHSLGLYPALHIAGVVDFRLGLQLVIERARLMSQVTQGGMLVVLGWHYDRLAEFLIEHEYTDIDIANDNTANQQVLSGPSVRLQEVELTLKDREVKTLRLSVSGAFHSRYMQHAMQSYWNYLQSIEFLQGKIPILSSTTAEWVKPSHLIEELAYQLVHPVRWRQTITYLLTAYRDISFLEIGPKPVLMPMIEQIKGAVLTGNNTELV